MPVQKSKSGLVAKYGSALKTAYEEHRNDEIEYSQFGELPGGINGIARLVDAKFDVVKEGKQNAGEYFFYAAGQVVSPETFKDSDGVVHRVGGLRTSVIEMMCDTPQSKTRKTQSDHVKEVIQIIKRLGVDTRRVDVENLEDTVAMLKEAKPFFKFSTRKGRPTPEYPDPKVFHSWGEAVEFDEGDTDAGSATDDDTLPPSPSAGSRMGASTMNGTAAPAKAPGNPAKASSVNRMANGAGAAQAASRGTVGARKAPSAPEPEVEFNEMDDAESLLALANAEDEESQQKLTDMAIAAGADQGLVSDAASWDDVYDLYKRAAEGTGSGEPEEEEEEAVEDKLVKREEVYLYNPPGYRKPIECEVVSVDAVRRIANLMNLDDKKKTYKGVSWDKLQPIS